MTGLSDSAFEELTAEIFGEPDAEPSPSESDSPEAIVQTEPEPTAPESQESAPDSPLDRERELDARERALAEREAELFEQGQRQVEQRNRVMAEWQSWQDRQAEQRASEYYQQLSDEYGPEVANQYQALRTTDLQRRQQAEQRAYGAEHGLTAAMIAMESVVAPEEFQRVLELTGVLVGQQDANQMQMAIQQERDRQAASNAEVQALQNEIRTLRMRVEAQNRPAAADAVDRGQAGSGVGTRLEDAPDFDALFSQLTGSFPTR